MAHLFEVNGKVAVITGGAGILCGEMARSLAKYGVKTAILDLNEQIAQKLAGEINDAGGNALAVKVNVLDKESLEAARMAVLHEFGRVDILINGAGGNNPKATTGKEQFFPEDLTASQEGRKSFFDLEPDGVQFVFNLNFLGTLMPTQIFGRVMAENGGGVIINI